ncbi:MAG: hypothetical protein GY858_10000 [Candidatus Omnitrophica bacterium]|nr:hypothetical protein [Candidatus Omnitrophota bacterium]
MNKICILIAILLSVLIVFTASFVAADNGEGYEEFLEERGWYSGVVNYLRLEKRTIPVPNLTIKEHIIAFVVDFVFSLACLWLTILILSGVKTLSPRKYLKFLVSINLTWLFFLFLFSFTWKLFNFLVLTLRPTLTAAFVDVFSIAIIFTASAIYIWLIARNFNLTFWGSVQAFFISHLFYCLIAFSFALTASKDNNIANAIRNTIGLRPIVHTYLSDLNQVTTGEGFFGLIRFRPFHL